MVHAALLLTVSLSLSAEFDREEVLLEVSKAAASNGAAAATLLWSASTRRLLVVAAMLEDCAKNHDCSRGYLLGRRKMLNNNDSIQAQVLSSCALSPACSYGFVIRQASILRGAPDEEIVVPQEIIDAPLYDESKHRTKDAAIERARGQVLAKETANNLEG